jgi:ATP-dependent helicase/nuclease subunit B
MVPSESPRTDLSGPPAVGGMTPLVSPLFHGPVLTEHTDLVPGEGVLGRPVWGPGALLGNLELRLGLPRLEMDDAVRVQHWSRRLATLDASRPRFYSKSYAVDSLGTAKTLLEWRDALVLAGWTGESVSNGGERLDALVELEASASATELASGFADRLLRVTREVEQSRMRLFDALEFAETPRVWPRLWQWLFALLEERGTPLRLAPTPVPCTAQDSDLGRVQALLRGESTSVPPKLIGDGSLLVLTGETSWEVAQAAAALLRAWEPVSAVVLRSGEVAALEAAFEAQGLPSLGWTSASPWRPALQVLPLALELAFEPRDPARVMELLTLPEGPFRGLVGRELTRALAEMPGIGGRPWLQAKKRIQEAGVSDEQWTRITPWLEAPGHSDATGAPRAALLEVTDRVRDWLQTRLAALHAGLDPTADDAGRAGAIDVASAALRRVRAFREALTQETRRDLTLNEVRQLLEEAAGPGHQLSLNVERAGRIDHVAHPAGLRSQRDVVLWWHCLAGAERRPRSPPWRRSELAALRAAGLSFVGAGEMLAIEAAAWRRTALAARQRLVLAMPRSALGQVQAPHPIWDEIVARLGVEPGDLACVTVEVRDGLALDVTSASLASASSARIASEVALLALPDAKLEWTVLPDRLPTARRYSAGSLEGLVSCPLKWVLKYPAGLRRSFVGALPSGPLLNGKLGHRLIEELHGSGVLGSASGIGDAAVRQFDRLVAEEAAVLLRPGQASELTQLRQQLGRAVAALARLLESSKLEMIGVEVQTEALRAGRQLEGRIDLLLRSASGREVVLDLKWGASGYRDLLSRGAAVQLAIYAALRQHATSTGELPEAGYFSLSDVRMLATKDNPSLAGFDVPVEGPPLSEVWRRLEAAASLVEDLLTQGRVPVTGLKRSLPLAAPTARDDAEPWLELEPGSGCKYCDYPALCGRQWEGFV